MIDIFDFLKKDLKTLETLCEGEPSGSSTSSASTSSASTSSASTSSASSSGSDPEPKTPLVYENSIDNIIVQLHNIAISKVDMNGITLVNSCFDDPKNPKKLVSSGEHVISIISSDPKKPIKKEDGIKKLQTYVQWFIGPDASKKLNDKNVLPLQDDGTSKEDKNEAKTKEGTSESIKNKHLFIKFLNEGEPAGSETGSETGSEKDDDFSYDEDDPKKKKELDKNNTTDKTDEELTASKGFYTIYSLKAFPGKKETAIKDAFKKLGGDVLKGINFSDWRSGSKTFSVKDVMDDFEEIFGKIDSEKFKNNIRKELDKALPNHSFESIQIYDKKSILNWLSKRLDKKDKLKIQQSDNSLCIKIGDASGEAGNEEQIEQARNKMIKRNISIISNIINKAIEGFIKTVKYRIKPEHIIVTKESGESRKLNIASIRTQIKDEFKKIKGKSQELEFKNKYGEDGYDTALNPEKQDDTDVLKTTLKNLKKITLGLHESIIDNIISKLIIENVEDGDNIENRTEEEYKNKSDASDAEAQSSGGDQTKISLDNFKANLEKQVKKVLTNDENYSVYLMSSKEMTSEIISKKYKSTEKIDEEKFDTASIIEIDNLTEEKSNELTKDKFLPIFKETLNSFKISDFGDIIEVQREVEANKEKLNSSQINTFNRLFNLIFEEKEDEINKKEISKEKIEEIEKEFNKLASSKLPNHNVDTKIDKSSIIIDELKENKIGNNDLYEKLKNSKYIFSICAKAKNILKESFEDFALGLFNLILEGKTKSPKEQFIRKLAHIISIKPNFIDDEKDRLSKLDIDPKIKEYISGDCKSDIKDGELNKDTKYFDQMHNDKAFKNAISELDKIINSTEEKKAEDAEIAKKEEEKRSEEKSELEKFKNKLEEILKKNPKFFEKYKDEIENSDFNKKIKTYLQINIKDDYNGNHLKNTSFLKKNITDDELKDSLEKLNKFYDEYSNSEEGKKEQKEIDNSKEDAKLNLKNNLDDKVIKNIFDEILQKFSENIITNNEDFYIVNSDVEEKRNITQINTEWVTTYKHGHQNRLTRDNGTIKSGDKLDDSLKIKLANLICEDLNFDIFLLERAATSSFYKGQLSKDKEAYKQKIEAGLKRINEVVPNNIFSKYLDILLKQYSKDGSKLSGKNETYIKNGKLKDALLNQKKFTDKMYNDFHRGELFAITTMLRVILYVYYFTVVGSYALMPADLSESFSSSKEKNIQKGFIVPFSAIKPKDPEPEKPEDPEPKKPEDPKVNDRKKKFNFFIIPMKGLKYKSNLD